VFRKPKEGSNQADKLLLSLHTKKYWGPWLSAVGKQWVFFKNGRIHVDRDDTTLFFHVLGGNSYWFGNWEVDWIQLVPVAPIEGDVSEGGDVTYSF